MSDILKKITIRKHEEVAERSALTSLIAIENRISEQTETRSFVAAIESKVSHKKAAVIAEKQQQVGCDKWLQTEIAKKIRALK